MIDELFTKAAKAERVARTALEDGEYDDAVSRAYYAMFNAARALLIDDDPANAAVSSHKGVLTKFHQTFIKPGRVERRFGEIINRAQTARHLADYGQEQIADNEARTHVGNAEEFLEKVRGLSPAISEIPPLNQSKRELLVEAEKEEAGRRSAVRMLSAASSGLGIPIEARLADDLVLYGSEDTIASMIHALVADPSANSDLRELARSVGVDLPGHHL